MVRVNQQGGLGEAQEPRTFPPRICADPCG